MPVRSTMADLISRTRDLIGDPAGASQRFSDQQVQDALDHNGRLNVRYAVLAPAPSLVQGGIYNYTDYYAGIGDWESDAVLQWGDFRVLTPATSDYLTGHWTFALAEPGQLPPVYITGKAFDIFAAGAYLCDAWAASLTLQFDFSADGRSFQRSQQVQMLRQQAQALRAQARPTVATMRRSDESTTAESAPLFALGNTPNVPWGEW